ncbi:hypothetical protein ASPBRDRAFT_210028 [Aspergillus brasiliensis CBS 101740]|uniref:Alpha/beta hydrolase fold-3 domain-containing protein n=1 Tax=Aspergillus brasiliensis (strain CBS 101740 / IMI 381727 / IBT 21946) TaxID=767769 RepID=A0A1L9U971_ASPBC|nr:hypothetical protein ASPBRDRAFT_210028 [Aspergillus brasiliensis CBS 101740]
MRYNLSVWDKIDAWLGLVSVGITLLWAAISGLYRGPSGADTYYHHLIQAVTKRLMTRFTSLQLQYLFPSYDQIYLDYCRHSRIKPRFVTNKQGLKGFWTGPPTAKYVVINFHVWPMHYPIISTTWLHVTYTLTPHATYPTQSREAVEALRYVIEDLGRPPSEVILVGDSAGANLCLAILSHLLHPSPDVPELRIGAPLKAIALLSPWLSFRHDSPSMMINEYKDIDAREVTERWSREYLNGKPSNYYTEALEAPEEWWQDALVEQTLVLAGSDEVLLDSIKAWVQKFSKSNPDTTLVIGRNECHIAPLIWPLFNDYHETEQGSALKCWLCERLPIS